MHLTRDATGLATWGPDSPARSRCLLSLALVDCKRRNDLRRLGIDLGEHVGEDIQG